MEIDVQAIPPHERYKLLIGLIVPRPIAFVSTISPDGHHNLAPFSFFAGVGSNPMTLLFCPANTPEGLEKDTLRNCKPRSEGGTGEFVVNVVPHALAAQMSACAEPLAYGESEFVLSKLTPSPALHVRPPRVLESPACFECRTLQVIRTNKDQPDAGNVVLGQVMHVHVADEAIHSRLHVDATRLDAIGRMGGNAYATTRDRFEVPRGKDAMR